MAAELSPEAKELSLVGKVEMRIALASSDQKLEDLLKTYLAPLLLKLGSDSAAVRNKVRLEIKDTCCGLRFPSPTADSGFPRSSPSASTSIHASNLSTLLLFAKTTSMTQLT